MKKCFSFFAVVFLAFSVLAEGEPVGMLQCFSVDTCATFIRSNFVFALQVVGSIFAGLLFYHFIRWAVLRVTYALLDDDLKSHSYPNFSSWRDHIRF